MVLQQAWRRVRSRTPVALYPALSIPWRLAAKWTVWRMARQDRKDLARNPITDVPPAALRFRVARACSIEQFSAAGQACRASLEAGLTSQGVTLADVHDALDFGCGCGRTLRAFRDRTPVMRLAGVDIDAQAIHWCQEHLPFAEFHANADRPPLPFPDGRFDLAWAISVFTHLPEDLQFQWLAELRRVLRPGGWLVATLHGPALWHGLPAATVRRIEERGFVFARTQADKGVFPEWYQTAWHTPRYVQERWAEHFEVCRYLEQGMGGHQDLVVLRRPPG